MAGHTELDFETAIEAGLIGAGGYAKRAPTAYDETLALFPEDVTAFLKDGQATKWGQLEALLGARTQATMLDSLAKELDTKGTLHVLRHGFKCYGKTRLCADPSHSQNPDSGLRCHRAREHSIRGAADQLGHCRIDSGRQAEEGPVSDPKATFDDAALTGSSCPEAVIRHSKPRVGFPLEISAQWRYAAGPPITAPCREERR